MRYLEIQSGITLSIDSIEGIEKLEGNRTKVYARRKTYISTYPYETLLSILKQEETVDKEVSNDAFAKDTMEKLNKVLDKSQHFAG